MWKFAYYIVTLISILDSFIYIYCHSVTAFSKKVHFIGFFVRNSAVNFRDGTLRNLPKPSCVDSNLLKSQIV